MKFWIERIRKAMLYLKNKNKLIMKMKGTINQRIIMMKMKMMTNLMKMSLKMSNNLSQRRRKEQALRKND